MAILHTITCQTCGQSKQVCCSPSDWPTECHECASAKAAQDRAVHLEGLQALTLEERLARIEAWIYDYKPPVALSDMRF